MDPVPSESLSSGLHNSRPENDSDVTEMEPLLLRTDICSNMTRLSNAEETASSITTSYAAIEPLPHQMMEDVENVIEKDTISKPSTTLHRFLYVPVLVLGYSTLAIFSWTIICILSYRPISTGNYGVSSSQGPYGSFPYRTNIHSPYLANEQWFHVARVMQSIVTVLTIPLTSSVCSKAAVVFLQRQTGVSLRQTMVLADKGWTDPKVYAKLLLFRGLKQYGSSFLFLAILLNIFGGIISPLQSLLLTSRTIQTPTGQQTINGLTDISTDLPTKPITTSQPFGDSNVTPIRVRSAITSTSHLDMQSRLWTGRAVNCSLINNANDSGPLTSCLQGGVTLGNMPFLSDPFLAQLPSGFNTGLIRQFLPRINSSATIENVTEAEFPTNCDTSPGSFYVNYANGTSELGYWRLIACMPADQTQSPWKQVRKPQYFSEALYLNLSYPLASAPQILQVSGLFKITMSTTAGFFELPNIMIGPLPGPLLNDDPINHCGLNCFIQSQWLGPNNLTSRSLTRRENTNGTYIITNSSLTLEISSNKGPLLSTTIALFGEGSFIEDRLSHPEAYINKENGITDEACIGEAPLINLLRNNVGMTIDSGRSSCLYKNFDGDSVTAQISSFLQSLYASAYFDSGEEMRNGFESSAFLANEAWMLSAESPSFLVSYDASADTLVPAISRTGIIIISMLLAVDLLSLLTMALYSAWTPCWTDQLDAFAMMRIGAAIAETIPLNVTYETDRMKVLDETPGWVGDATGGKGEVGKLGIGARVPLRKRRAYESYYITTEK